MFVDACFHGQIFSCEARSTGTIKRSDRGYHLSRQEITESGTYSKEDKKTKNCFSTKANNFIY
ncbi:hypothetical protein DPMN_035372 [Dreissena polymorpha]|uniref:Uncharacterized protein n=1 Tax=Dreissena polymorpha TaxID=45954 RepID=A0A9D4RLV5_DREPO|nr:hypothetical protein DPMN_035371 [Dreissena polymorpha]KAH3872158.1 hypothetical protein DPMN_035372 [Dreissena polymorpha]